MLRRRGGIPFDARLRTVPAGSSSLILSGGPLLSPTMLPKLRARLGAVFSTAPPELHGSVASHRSYILLNAPFPPSNFPSRFSTPVQRALQLRVTRWGGIVNFVWTGSPNATDSESTSVTAFSPLGGHIHFPALSLSNVDEVAENLRQHATVPPVSPALSDAQIHMYVCTHGARDCRCGNTGGKVFQTLRAELDRRVLADPNGPAKDVVLGEVGHVGGHTFAANLLVFPHGEWLGLLTPDDVPRVLDTILSTEIRPLISADPPMCHQFWRGRMGLGKDEQLSLHASHS
ncbi:Sucrase/ferredoxin-like-domain-containing protein [Mycena maculata]|uniref:Sucrase/ferredoxin-like-domain-containing protein n=1 Tax=Mycena maculata TaxID=230809 RepID=A0AAD7JQA5_9AGAR|nr:Sucrase/ferredoxin-like-domain-containing protein [Mycena maculata]